MVSKLIILFYQYVKNIETESQKTLKLNLNRHTFKEHVSSRCETTSQNSVDNWLDEAVVVAKVAKTDLN